MTEREGLEEGAAAEAPEEPRAVRVADRVRFWCPGCDTVHEVTIEGANPWTWSGDLGEGLTLSPSVLVRKHLKDGAEGWRCHSFVGGGSIVFLEDCSHGLKGQTVKLPAVSSWRFGAE